MRAKKFLRTKRKKSERCVIKEGPLSDHLAGRIVQLGWLNPGCTLKELDASGGLRPYKLRRTGETNEAGRSLLEVVERSDIVEFRNPPHIQRPARNRRHIPYVGNPVFAIDPIQPDALMFERFYDSKGRSRSSRFDLDPTVYRCGL